MTKGSIFWTLSFLFQKIRQEIVKSKQEFIAIYMKQKQTIRVIHLV